MTCRWNYPQDKSAELCFNNCTALLSSMTQANQRENQLLDLDGV